MNNKQNLLTTEVKARAASLGFAVSGITNADPLANFHLYSSWLANGHHAGMMYLESTYHKSMREDPRRLFPMLKSIIVLGLPYRLTTQLEMEQLEAGLICGYAIGEDYHQYIPHTLELLVDWLQELSPHAIRPLVCTDSAPILERELAVRSGLGWIGKNSCLISPQFGSALLLAEIFTDVELDVDDPFNQDHCGTCDRCVRACPTDCILPDRTVDANRCISYHTIENRGEIPIDIVERFTNQVFGCDICQVACPWNRFERLTNLPDKPDHLLSVNEMTKLVDIDQDEFFSRFGHTPITRIKREGLIRNVKIVLRH